MGNGDVLWLEVSSGGDALLAFPTVEGVAVRRFSVATRSWSSPLVLAAGSSLSLHSTSRGDFWIVRWNVERAGDEVLTARRWRAGLGPQEEREVVRGERVIWDAAVDDAGRLTVAVRAEVFGGPRQLYVARFE